MKKLLMISILLAACGDNLTEEQTTPDAAAILVVYPCNLQHENCQAARLAAEAVCDRRERCDDLYEVDHVQCVAWVMGDLCARLTYNSGGTCNSGPYEQWPGLEACVEVYTAAACGGDQVECKL